MKKKKAPKSSKKKEVVPGYFGGGDIKSLAPLQSAAASTRDAKTKNGLGDYIHDYGAAMLETAGGLAGIDPTTTTRTAAGEKVMQNVVDPATGIMKKALPGILGAINPALGAGYAAATGLAGKLTGGDKKEEYEAAQEFQEGGEVLDSAATAKKPVIVPAKAPVASQYNWYDPKTKSIKYPATPEGGRMARQNLALGTYLKGAQGVLDSAMRKKLGLKADAAIPAEATLSPEEVTATLKNTPYTDYYGNLRRLSSSYQKVGANLYGDDTEFVPSVAGETEAAEGQVGDIAGTAYGQRHRALKFASVAPAVTPAPVVVPTRKKGGIIYGYQKGGEVKGAGTAKSDSIDADIVAGSFVVPAENAPIAAMLREKYLLPANGKKADTDQAGGTHVKLSDGEHLFTPEEAAKLVENGINLDLLAPNAEKGAPGKAEGGGVGDADSAIRYSPDRKKVWSNNAGMYVSVTSAPGRALISGAKTVLHEGTGEYVPVAKFNQMEGKGGGNGKVVSKSKPSTGSSKASPGGLADMLTGDAVAMESLPSRDVTLTERSTTPTGLEASLRTTPATTNTVGDKKKGAAGADDKKGGLSFEDALGYGQVAMGLTSLFKDGKRPVDQLDADLVAVTEKAKADAQYGLDPATKQDYLSDIETGRIQNVGLAAQLSGSDPTQAMANARAATNAYSKQLLDVASLDARVKQSKQGVAANLVSNRAEQKRRLFEDKMKAFEQNQMAGADLLGAGISNVLGAKQAEQTAEFLKTVGG